MNKNLVYTSAGDNTDFYKHWCGNSKDYDLWVTYYGDDEKKYKLYSKHSDYITKRKGFKFQNFYDLYNNKDLSQYERIFILDDDIIISTQDINKMFNISEKYDLNICGPTFNPRCKISHPKTINNPKWFMRYTNYVEVNVPLFKKEALRRLMDVFDPKLVGWGIDRLAAWANGYNKIALVDAVVCINPQDAAKGGVRELTKGDETWAIRADIWHEVADRYKVPRRSIIINKSFVSIEEGLSVSDPGHDKTISFEKNNKDKIAILMLAYKSLDYPNVWLDFFDEGSDRSNFYTHVKNKDKCTSKLLKENHIKKHIPTKWGDISLVKATNNMLEEAYKDETNKIFILTSADTVPLYGFDKIYDDIINSKKSWFNILEQKETHTACSQFFLLTREHVKLILDNRDKEDTHDIPKTVPDESYYYKILSQLDKNNIENKKIMQCKIDNRTHRCIYNSLNMTSLKRKRKSGAYFFRKIEPNNQHITYNYLKHTR
tara:strand:+ start:11809 stop:13272 length:1464 start_codon:yes stop_codon:yes gene_type:complete